MPRQSRWPWEEPHDRLEQLEHAEIRMLRWIINAQVAIGRMLVEQRLGQEKIMANLENITAALADLNADVDKTATDVLAALADLRAQIDALVAGQVTQEQIDALTASIGTADAAVEALDAAVSPPTP